MLHSWLDCHTLRVSQPGRPCRAQRVHWLSAGLLVMSASEPNVVQAAEEMFQTMPLPPALRDNSSSQASLLRHHILLADDRPQQATSPDEKL